MTIKMVTVERCPECGSDDYSTEPGGNARYCRDCEYVGGRGEWSTLRFEVRK